MPENTRSSELEVLLRAYLKSATSSTGDWAAEEEEINRRISDVESFIASKVEEARIEGEQIGAAKTLDYLWEDSYNRCGHDTSKIIEQEMVRIFGKDWSSSMYSYMLRDGVSKPSCHPSQVPVVKALQSKEGDS